MNPGSLKPELFLLWMAGQWPSLLDPFKKLLPSLGETSRSLTPERSGWGGAKQEIHPRPAGHSPQPPPPGTCPQPPCPQLPRNLSSKVYMLLEFPLWLSRLKTQLVSMRTRAQSQVSPSGMRIWCSHELWYRSQMQPGSGVAVAVAAAPI